jgi:hypothetical protein
LRKEPKSSWAWLVRGIFEVNAAWMIRGSRVGNEVDQGAARSFEEHLIQAKTDLEKASRLNLKDPFAATWLIPVSYGLGLNRRTMETYFARATKAAPGLFRAHVDKLTYLLPKWRGSEQETQAFVQECMAKSVRYPVLAGISTEALIEEAASQPSYDQAIGRPDVWNRIEANEQKTFKAYPDWLIPHCGLAETAYEAKQFKTAAREFDFIGDRWVPDSGWNSLDDYNQARVVTYAWMAWDAIEHGHDKEGGAWLEKVFPYDKKNPLVLKKLVTWYHMTGDPKKAAEIEKLAAQVPQTANEPP